MTRTTDDLDGRTGQLPPGVSRRGVLAVGVIGVSAAALAGCSQAASPGNGGDSTGSSDPGGPAAPGASTPGSSAPGSATAGTATPLAKLSDIKVGEAISATGPDGAKLIIARPTANTVAAFSAICTHQGCTVAPAGKELDCPCHGSVYNATTGAVIDGPAPRPLPTVSVTLSGQDVLPG